MTARGRRRAALKLALGTAVAAAPLSALAAATPWEGASNEDKLAALINEAIDHDPELRAELISWLAAEYREECRAALRG